MALAQVDEGIWVHSIDIRFGGIAPLPHLMTVIRLSGGSLLIHSPCRADAQTKAALAELGPVEAIVAPNWWHDLFLREWVAAYPNAKLYADPNLVAQRATRTLPFQPPLDGSISPWPEIDLLYVDEMRLWLDELVLLHRPSRSLIIADLAFYLTSTRPASMKAWFRFIGAYPGCKVPGFFRLAPRSRNHLREKIKRMLSWDFERLIVGHGDVIETNGKDALCQAFAWLEP
jgi:Domain of unknown function (DUF4336)